jgi:hypothetical protein
MGQKLTQRTTNPNPLTLADIIHAVSVADTTQSPQGSSYKNTLQALINLIKLSGVGNWKTVAPTVNDDSTQGYQNGAFWFDENAQKLYILNDNSAGVADWVDISSLISLQTAYDGGNNVNGADVIIDGGATHIFAVGLSAADGNTGNNVIALGSDAALNNSGDNVTAIGFDAAKSNIGNIVNAIGISAGENNTGDDLVAIGAGAGLGNTANEVIAIGNTSGFNNIGARLVSIGINTAQDNEGNDVNALGLNAGKNNEGDNVNALGSNAGQNNTSNNSNFFGINAGSGNNTSHGVTVFSPESVPTYADHTAASAALTVANGCVAGQVYIYRNESNDTIGYVLPA